MIPATEQVAKPDAVPGEPAISAVGQPAQTGPAGGSQQPAQTDGAIGLPENGYALDQAAIRINAMHYSHQLLQGLAINRRIKPGSGNILEGQRPVAILRPQESHLPATKRAFAIVQ